MTEEEKEKIKKGLLSQLDKGFNEFDQKSVGYWTYEMIGATEDYGDGYRDATLTAYALAHDAIIEYFKKIEGDNIDD